MIELIVLLVVVLVGIIIGLKRYKKITRDISPNQELLSKGILISIKPEQVEIRTSEQWIETEKPITKTVILDSVAGKTAFIGEKRIVSYLIYNAKHNNKLVKYVSPPIYKDEASVLMALSHIDALKIYIDPSNMENYYFDVSNFQ